MTKRGRPLDPEIDDAILEAAGRALRELIAFETSRAEQLLDSGVALVGLLRGWARVAVAGYIAGGRAAIDALRRADHDVLRCSPRVRRQNVARHFVRLLLQRSRNEGAA